VSQETATETPTKAKAEKPPMYVRAMFAGSSDPSATDPVYWAVNGDKFLVPREKEFVIREDYIAHLMAPEFRPKSVHNPRTGSNHVVMTKVSFNRPQILERLTEKEAAPLLRAQEEEARKEREANARNESQLAQEAE
jgi:hypothetical protein